jgi:phospholipid N-methyltransferase
MTHQEEYAQMGSTQVDKIDEYLLFARMFLKHPKMLGSLIPSSKHLSQRLMRKIAWSRAHVIVEYGPGVGTLTAEVLGRMRKDAVLVVIDTNQEFIAHLKRKFADPRLRVCLGSASDVEYILKQMQLGAADYVISGIPFTAMPPEVIEDILQQTRRVLKADGNFLVYQFTTAVVPYLSRHFRKIQTEFEPRNVLPARTFQCAP